jgi:hypothetical protein
MSSMAECPNCQSALEVSSSACSRCGIVFSTMHSESDRPPCSSPSLRPDRPFRWLSLLLPVLVGAGVIGVLFTRPIPRHPDVEMYFDWVLICVAIVTVGFLVASIREVLRVVQAGPSEEATIARIGLVLLSIGVAAIIGVVCVYAYVGSHIPPGTK